MKAQKNKNAVSVESSENEQVEGEEEYEPTQ